MIRKYHNHKLQTTLWHREEEPLNHGCFCIQYVGLDVSNITALCVTALVKAILHTQGRAYVYALDDASIGF